MPISLRLNQELEKNLSQVAVRLKTTKTSIIKHLLEDYLSKILEVDKHYPYQYYQKLHHLVPGSGDGSLSTSHRNKMLEYLKRKQNQ